MQVKVNPVLEEGPCQCKEEVEGGREGSGGKSDSGRIRVALGENRGGNLADREKSARGSD